MSPDRGGSLFSCRPFYGVKPTLREAAPGLIICLIMRLDQVPDSAGRQGVAAARQERDSDGVTQAEEIDRLERENVAIDWQPGRNPVFYTR